MAKSKGAYGAGVKAGEALGAAVGGKAPSRQGPLARGIMRATGADKVVEGFKPAKKAGGTTRAGGERAYGDFYKD